MTHRRMKMLRVAVAAAALLTVPATSNASDADAPSKSLIRQGAREWGPYCGSCHNARPAGERSPAEWDVIMMHMRVRANLPAQDAQAIVEYLKAR